MPNIPKDYFRDSGVYLIRNVATNKVYIGSSTRNAVRRVQIHFRELRKNKHQNRYLQHAWNKYGSNAFRYRIIKRCEPSKCLHYEQIFLDKYQSYERDSGYNICPTAGNLTGVKWTEAAKLAKKRQCSDPKFVERVREIFKRPKTESHREKLRQANLGKTHPTASAEARHRMGSANRGKKMSPEKCAKMKTSAIARWRKHNESKRQSN